MEFSQLEVEKVKLRGWTVLIPLICGKIDEISPRLDYLNSLSNKCQFHSAFFFYRDTEN